MVTDELYAPFKDEKYKAFNSRLVTGTLPLYGVRLPILRKLSKEVAFEDIEIKYHEDVLLKSFSLGYSKHSYKEKLEKLTTLLPYFESWDQTDSAITVFKPKEKEKEIAYRYFSELLKSKKTYYRRLAIVFFLQNRKLYDREQILDILINADSTEYYVSMALAWALSIFIIEDPTLTPLLNKVSKETKRRTEQKIRDSHQSSTVV